MKYLIVCDGGNVRSNALGFHLKWHHNREAIAIGRLYMSPETMEMMTNWADRIVLMQPHMAESIPEAYHDKIVVVDVGVDRFGINIHPELNALTSQAAQMLVNAEKNPAILGGGVYSF